MKRIIQIPMMLLFISVAAFGQNNEQKKVNNNKSVFSMYVCPSKPQFTEGEEVVLYVTIKNNSNNKDSLLNLLDDYILEKTKIWNDDFDNKHHAPLEVDPQPMVYTVFQGGESKLIELGVNSKGKGGVLFYGYYPAGKYNLSIELKDLNYSPLHFNQSSFIVVQPEGNELEEFKDLVELSSTYRKINKDNDYINRLIDESIEFLYKYPRSIYLYNVIAYSYYMKQFSNNEQYNNSSYEEQYIEHLKFYLENNASDKRSLHMIQIIHSIISKSKNEKKATIYLENYKDECTNDVLKSRINEALNKYKKNN